MTGMRKRDSRGWASVADDLEEHLLKQLAMVNDWLKFAEAKNALLVGLASAGAAGALKLVGDMVASNGGPAVVVLVVAEAVMLASLGLSLMSFLPKTDLHEWATRFRGPTARSDNLYFYGDLAKYDATRVAEIVSQRYGERNIKLGDGAIEIAEQTVINSRITLWKLQLFRNGLIFFSLGVALSTVAGLIAVLAD